MKKTQIINILIALSLILLAVVVAAVLSSTFQDPTLIMYSLFGKVIGGIGILYVLSGFMMKIRKQLFSRHLFITGGVLLLAGIILAICYDQKPLERNLPKELSYYKFIHMKEIYSAEDSTSPSGYQYVDTPFTREELDTLTRILKEQHKEFIVGRNGEILVSQRSIWDAVEMNYINDLLRKRMYKETKSQNP